MTDSKSWARLTLLENRTLPADLRLQNVYELQQPTVMIGRSSTVPAANALPPHTQPVYINHKWLSKAHCRIELKEGQSGMNE